MQRIIFILIVLMITAYSNVVTAFAIDVAEYRTTLTNVHSTVIEMINGSTIDDSMQGKKFDAAGVVHIRQMLPIKLRVNTMQGQIEVSNQWLHSSLDEYVTANEASKRTSILVDIEQRISAIIWKLDELTNASASETTKDRAKQKISEILAREEYQSTAEKEKSAIEKWIMDFLDWLSGLFPKSKTEPSPSGMSNVAYWLQAVILVLAVGLLGFGIYKLAPVIFPSIRRRRKSEAEDRIILGETIEAGHSSDDLYAAADKLARSGDLRGAIRKGYIALLFDLSKKKQIGLARHKTNRDYLRDVRKKPELYADMKTLTGVYESHWYGSESSDESVWARFKKLSMEASDRV